MSKTTSENIRIIYEDNHLIAVNKRPGDLVQGDKTGDEPLSEILKVYLKNKYDKPGNVYLGVVHRLDRPTSGVVLFAKTSKALSRLNRIFAERKSKKIYWAIVKKPAEDRGELVHYLKRNPKQNKSVAHKNEVPDSKKAILSYRVLKHFDKYALLEIILKTGRHHQIRAQLAAMGCPIKGDLKYGFPRSNSEGGIHLHARELKLEHPVRREEIKFVADPPTDALWDLCV